MGTLYYVMGMVWFWWLVAMLAWRLLRPILIGFVDAHERASQGYIPAVKPEPAPQPGLFFELLRRKR